MPTTFYPGNVSPLTYYGGDIGAFLNLANVLGKPAYFPAGIYTWPSDVSITRDGLSIIGDSPGCTQVATFGNAVWNTASNFTGTWFRYTGSGTALTITGKAATIRNVGFVGPGTGTPTGVKVGSLAVSGKYMTFDNVYFCNFFNNLYLLQCYQSEFLAIKIRAAGGIGLLLGDATSAVNGNTFVDADFTANLQALSAIGATTNVFCGGVSESNGDATHAAFYFGSVAVDTEAGNNNSFNGFYFEDQTAQFAVRSRGDRNSFNSCHFTNTAPVQFDGNFNQIICCEGTAPLVLNGHSSILEGSYSGTVTDNAADTIYEIPAQNVLFCSTGGPQTMDAQNAKSVASTVANTIYGLRFSPPVSFTVGHIDFIWGTGNTGNIDMAILDSSGNVLWSLGSTASTTFTVSVVNTVTVVGGPRLQPTQSYYFIFMGDSIISALQQYNVTGGLSGQGKLPDGTFINPLFSNGGTFPIGAGPITVTPASTSSRFPYAQFRI